METQEMVNHPKHYQGCKFEAIDIIESYNLGFCLGNAIKYLLRAGKKDNINQEIRKAIWYIQRYEQELTEGITKVTQITNKTNTSTNINTIEDIIEDFHLQEDIGKAVRSILIATQVSQVLDELEKAKSYLSNFLRENAN